MGKGLACRVQSAECSGTLRVTGTACRKVTRRDDAAMHRLRGAAAAFRGVPAACLVDQSGRCHAPCQGGLHMYQSLMPDGQDKTIEMKTMSNLYHCQRYYKVRVESSRIKL